MSTIAPSKRSETALLPPRPLVTSWAENPGDSYGLITCNLDHHFTLFYCSTMCCLCTILTNQRCRLICVLVKIIRRHSLRRIKRIKVCCILLAIDRTVTCRTVVIILGISYVRFSTLYDDFLNCLDTFSMDWICINK